MVLYREYLSETRLVQKLLLPTEKGHNPFAFGAGKSGLSEEALGILKNVFTFDYMGAGEFENGSVAKALEFIYEQAAVKKMDFGCFYMDNNCVYYICHSDYKSQIEKRIKSIHSGRSSSGKIKLRVLSGFEKYFSENHKKENVGWLELNNKFLWFVDKDMYKKFARILGF